MEDESSTLSFLSILLFVSFCVGSGAGGGVNGVIAVDGITAGTKAISPTCGKLKAANNFSIFLLL